MPFHMADVDGPPPAHEQKPPFISASPFPATENNKHISAYKPNYILPAYYTESPDYSAYDGRTPDHEGLSHGDFKYQLSVKLPLAALEIKGATYTGYLAYTQLSYWQIWNHSSWYFRENNYEPRLFVAFPIHGSVAGWATDSLYAGFAHQSNGVGGPFERTWNRLFIEQSFQRGSWKIHYEAWDVLKDQSYVEHNPDLIRYLGYGQLVVSYTSSHGNVFSLRSRNNITSGFSRGLTQFSWSFPLRGIHVSGVDGYLQVSSGYGQSLVEYDHRTNALGIGIAYSDW